MARLVIEATQNTPQVAFDAPANSFWITGLSKAEEPIDFYTPIIDWVKELEPTPETREFNFKLEYFNSSSNKLILELLRVLEQKENVAVNWHYEEIDEAMRDAGEDYMENLDLKFNLCPFED